MIEASSLTKTTGGGGGRFILLFPVLALLVSNEDVRFAMIGTFLLCEVVVGSGACVRDVGGL